MKNINKISIAVALVFCSTLTLAANSTSDLLVTPTFNKSVGTTELKLEFVNEEKVTSMQFDMDLSGVNPKNINMKNCVSGLPKTHQGGCNMVDGKLRVLVYSASNVAIPTGTIGSVSFSGVSSVKKMPSVSVNNMKLAAPTSNAIHGNVIVDKLHLYTESLRK